MNVLKSSISVENRIYVSIRNCYLQIPNYKVAICNYPTVPSKETERSFWASTANSIGSLFKTSLA